MTMDTIMATDMMTTIAIHTKTMTVMIMDTVMIMVIIKEDKFQYKHFLFYF